MKVLPTLFVSALLQLALHALPPVDNPTFTQEERQAIGEREKQIDEANSTKNFALSNANDKRVVDMIAGDFSSLDVLVANKDLENLWFLFGRARFNELGRSYFSARLLNSPGFAFDGPVAFNERVQEEVRERLIRIPGHAKYLGDKIDQMSNEPGHFGNQLRWMMRLGDLGGMEAIQQIGRFLEDGRRPEGDFFHPLSGRTNPDPNWRVAIHAMHNALGNASPIYLPTSRFIPGPRTPTNQQCETMIAWWKSDAARPYREWTPEKAPSASALPAPEKGR